MINFLQVEKSVEVLKNELAAGKLDEQTFESRLIELIDVAEDGRPHLSSPVRDLIGPVSAAAAVPTPALANT